MANNTDNNKTRLNMSEENSELARNISNTLGVSHGDLVKRLLKEENRRLKIDTLNKEDSEFLFKVTQLTDALLDFSSSYASSKAILNETSIKGYQEQIADKEKTLKLTTEQVEKLSVEISEKDQIINELKSTIAELEDTNKTLQAENKTLQEDNHNIKKSYLALDKIEKMLEAQIIKNQNDESE